MDYARKKVAPQLVSPQQVGGIAARHPARREQTQRDLLLVGWVWSQGRGNQRADDDRGQHQESNEHQNIAAPEAGEPSTRELAHRN